MKIKHKKKYPIKIMIASASVVLLIACSFVYVYTFKGNIFRWKASGSSINTDKKSIDYGPATPDQQSAGSQTKTDSSSDTPPNPTVIPDSTKKSVEVSIISHSQSKNGSTFQIRTLISALDGTGVCTLTLTSPSQTTVTKTANTQSLASTSTCQGFDVPTSELPVGTWHAVINYSSDSLVGSTSIDEVIK